MWTVMVSLVAPAPETGGGDGAGDSGGDGDDDVGDELGACEVGPLGVAVAPWSPLHPASISTAMPGTTMAVPSLDRDCLIAIRLQAGTHGSVGSVNFFNQPTVTVGALPDGAYLLDVRENDEWQAGHAPDAVHIPLSELNARAGEVPNDRDVYVICRSGHRSAQAVAAFNNAGWTASNVDGGMHAWADAGRPMVSESGSEPFVA
jgi:rhodanese-related sulfurtransferase